MTLWLYMVGQLELLRSVKLTCSQIGLVAVCFGQVWYALVRCIFTYKLPLLLTMNFNPSMSYTNSLKMSFYDF